MIRLMLLLLGTPAIRRSRTALMSIGLLLLLAGIAVFIDGLDGSPYFPARLLGWLMLAEAVVMMLAAGGTVGTQKRLLVVRALLILVLGILVVDPGHASRMTLSLAFGVALALDGILRMVSSFVVRFQGWRGSLAAGLAETLFAIFLFEPWPTHYAGTVSYCIGVGLMLSGAALLRLARHLGRLGEGESLPVLFSRGWRQFPLAEAPPSGLDAAPLMMHVWTAVGTAREPLPRPVIDRYIAAVDRQGVISTGHAALELAPDLYISHYPDLDIDHSPEEFGQMLRAGVENDVPGRFQPSYAIESAQWCPSTVQLAFEQFNAPRLRAYWHAYRADTTYNLTNRNCSSTVALALETALEGVLAPHRGDRGYLARALFSPELWVAAQIRKRAETMAWTPGLVLDYARALYGVLDPPPLAWASLARTALRTWRNIRGRERSRANGR